MKSLSHEFLVVCLALGAGCSAVQAADDVWLCELGRDGLIRRADAIPPGPADFTEVYDNARDDFVGGRTVLNRRARTGGREVGDDLNLSSYSGTTLDSTIHTIVNFSQDAELRRIRSTFRWYDRADSRLLGEVSFPAQFAVPLPPETGTIIYAAEGFWDSFNITLADQIYFTLQYSEPVGIDIEDIGQLYGGPINTGSSSRFIRDFTLGQDIDLGDDQTNLGMAIRVNPVPAPATALAVMTICPWLARRRR
jgi:hypothetical protein